MADIPKHIFAALQCAGGYVAEIDPASIKLSPNLQREIQRAGGLHPQIAINLTSEPVIEFNCYDIQLASAPELINAGNPIHIYLRALTDTFGLGTGWISLICASGLLVPVTLSGSRGKLAQLNVACHLTSSDGDTSPVTVGTTAATPTAPADYYMLGEVAVGSTLDEVNDFSLTFGYNVVKNAGANGHPYPTRAYIDGSDSKASINLEQMALATQARLTQGSVETTLTAAFRKLNQAAIPVDVGGMLVTGLKGAVTIPSLNAQRPSSIQLDIDFLANDIAGTNYLQFATVSE